MLQMVERADVASARDGATEQPCLAPTRHLARDLVFLAFHRRTLRLANLAMCVLLGAAFCAQIAHPTWADLSASVSCMGTLIVGYAVTLGQRETCMRLYNMTSDTGLNDRCSAYGTGLLIASLAMLSFQSGASQLPLLAPVLLGAALLLQAACLVLLIRFSKV